MSEFFDILTREDVNCEVKNAFCFDGKTLFLCLGAADFEMLYQATALVAADISDERVLTRVIATFPDGPIDYFARSPDDHYVLVIGGQVHHLFDRSINTIPAACEPYIRKLCDAGGGRVAQLGDEGEVHLIEADDILRKLETHVSADIYDFHAQSPDSFVVAGSSGTLLEGDRTDLRLTVLPTDRTIKSIYQKADRSILIGGRGGWASVVRDGEMAELSGCTEDINAIIEHNDVEYWGDSDIGILKRDGSELVPAYETEFAFNLNVADKFLTVNAGVAVYVTDGSNWRQFEITKDPIDLVQRVPLDFTPK